MLQPPDRSYFPLVAIWCNKVHGQRCTALAVVTPILEDRRDDHGVACRGNLKRLEHRPADPTHIPSIAVQTAAPFPIDPIAGRKRNVDYPRSRRNNDTHG